MITPELEQFLAEQRATGATDEQIKQQLLGVGWDQATVDGLFAAPVGQVQTAVESAPVGVVTTGAVNATSPDTEAYLHKWNWGAFFFGWIWGVGTGVFIALLSLIPVVGLVMPFYLGASGSRLAWKARYYQGGIEQFKKEQKTWAKWGVLYFVFYAALPIVLVALAISGILTEAALTGATLFNTDPEVIIDTSGSLEFQPEVTPEASATPTPEASPGGLPEASSL